MSAEGFFSRNQQFHISSAVVIMLLLTAGASAIDATLDTVLRQMVADRLAAYDHGNADAYRQLIADDFVHVDDQGVRRTIDEVMARVSKHSGSTNRHEVGKLNARQFGDIAVADVEITEYLKLGPREMALPAHELDVFVNRNSKWLFLQHSETPAATTPVPAQVEAAELDQYTGQYEWWPGYIEIVSRKGDKLFVQAVGDEPTELQPSSHESFFVAGDPSMVVFVRNPKGQVTHFLVHFPDGQVISAKKIK